MQCKTLDKLTLCVPQVWRLLSNFVFLGGISMNLVVNLLWMCVPPLHAASHTHTQLIDARLSCSFRYGVQLESVTYGGRSADFAWALLFSAAVLLASTLLVPSMALSSALVIVLVYLWSKANQTSPCSFFGFFTVPGFYLPFVLVCWTVVQGGSPLEEVRGIVAAHLFYFLTTVWPRAGGPTLASTPEGVRQAVQWAFGGHPTVAPGYVRPPPQQRAFQGVGRRLND